MSNPENEILVKTEEEDHLPPFEIPESLQTAGAQILNGIRDIELDPDEVQQIWDARPAQLSPEARAVIIEQLRRDRAMWNQQKAKGKGAPRAKKSYTPVPTDLDLDDLELDLENL